MTTTKPTSNRFRRLLASVTALALVAATAVVFAQEAPASDGAAQEVALQASGLHVANSESLGSYLTDGQGQAVYLFLDDSHALSTCYADCAAAWLPVLVADPAQLQGNSEGVNAGMLATAVRSDGLIQLTYNGWPLYTYTGDSAPGDVTGHKANSAWFLVTPDGTGVGRSGDQLGASSAPNPAGE